MDIREFKNVYSHFAPSVIWDWCAKPSAEEIDEKLLGFEACGISKVYIRPSNGLVLPYLSPDYFELIRTAARRSAKHGIKLYICDEGSQSSGSGGGEITSVSDYRMLNIMRVHRRELENSDELLTIKGDEIVILRDRSSFSDPDRTPIADITDAFVTECFTDTVYKSYFRECKRFLGIEIAGFLTGINFAPNEAYFSKSAIKRLGYDTPSSASGILISPGKKYFDSFSECVCDNFTGLIKETCNNNALSLSVSVGGNGKISRQIQYVKADRISLRVNTESPDFIEIKLAQSVSSQFEKPMDVHLLTPTFSPCSHRYNAATFMTAFGAENIIYESVPYSLSDRRKYEDNTITLSYQSEKAISDRVSRMCFVAKGTTDTPSTLIIYNNSKKELFTEIAEKLLSAGVPFHMAEEIYFKKFAVNTGDYIAIGNCEYTTLITDDPSGSLLKKYKGQIITADKNFVTNYTPEEGLLHFESENDLIINRRYCGDDEYIFITSQKEDAQISVIPGDKKLFAGDSSNGELYRITENEGECHFTIKSGKTVMLIHSSELSEDNAPPFTEDAQFAPCENDRELPFILSAAEDNVMPVKKVDAFFGEKTFRDSNTDSLHRDFYALADGEKVKVDYIFDADKENTGEISVWIENADNADSVILNGVNIENLTPSSKDCRFFGANITKLIADGKNVLTLEYRKSNNYTPTFTSLTPSHFYSYNITSFEPVYLCGDFDVKENNLVRLSEYENDITKSGMEYYYGPVSYSTKLPEKDLGEKVLAIEGYFDICQVKIGKRSFTYFCETPLIELFNLDAGATVEITLYNTPYNLMRTQKDAKPFGLRELELCSFKY